MASRCHLLTRAPSGINGVNFRSFCCRQKLIKLLKRLMAGLGTTWNTSQLKLASHFTPRGRATCLCQISVYFPVDSICQYVDFGSDLHMHGLHTLANTVYQWLKPVDLFRH